MIFNRIGIIYHPLNKAAFDLGQQISDYLQGSGADCWLGSAWESDQLKQRMDGTELVITTGGDGTILRAAQAVLPLDIPIASVNLGKLGFMTEIPADEAMVQLQRIFGGEGWDDCRSVLEVSLASGGRPEQQFLAVNDVVAARGGIARIICVECRIGDAHFATFKGDGALVATATGSTGYNFAAGGPVLHPDSTDMLLTPILPHLGRSYSLVVTGDKTIGMKVSTNHQATLCIDGHINVELKTGDVIQARTSGRRLRFIRLRPENSFYAELDHKLKGNRLT
ncbi:putative sugar kinase [Dehalogenimonas alkenigignens]|uniref:NAD kinase n=1 Tax=Dehalogenimonas alkenigignens TaxID=1217799 RepID=A0A0W0GI81_9CHLR|nr:NAD(+)/NADH kinase [Dehalogenimonas alkenigignens]KTB48245.1 putative sugar kinase [Dehalogenimonas alkenigignens]